MHGEVRSYSSLLTIKEMFVVREAFTFDRVHLYSTGLFEDQFKQRPLGKVSDDFNASHDEYPSHA